MKQCDPLGCALTIWLCSDSEVNTVGDFFNNQKLNGILTDKQIKEIKDDWERLGSKNKKGHWGKSVCRVISLPKNILEDNICDITFSSSPIADLIDLILRYESGDNDGLIFYSIPKLWNIAGSCKAVCQFLYRVALERESNTLKLWYKSQFDKINYCTAKNSFIIQEDNKSQYKRTKENQLGGINLIHEIGGKLFIEKDQLEKKLIRKNENNEWQKYLNEPTLFILRRWNSFTPLFNDVNDVGGGYFIWTPLGGIVIDPGFDFIHNFFSAGFSLKDISVIIVTHAHPDHLGDMTNLLTLLYEFEEFKLKEELKIKSVFSPLITWGMYESYNKRHPVKLLLSLSSFMCIEKFIPLNVQMYYEINILSPGVELEVTQAIRLLCLPTNHSDIVGSKQGVGLLLINNNNPKGFIYTSDTGMDSNIVSAYQSICDKNNIKNPIVLCNIGGINNNDLIVGALPHDRLFYRPPGLIWPASFRYKQHLGILGVESLIEVIKPQILLLSELGQECKKFRKILIDGIKSNLKVRCLIADLGLSVEIFNGKGYAINEGLNTQPLKFDSIKTFYGSNTLYIDSSINSKVLRNSKYQNKKGWMNNLPHIFA